MRKCPNLMTMLHVFGFNVIFGDFYGNALENNAFNLTILTNIV